MLLFALLAVATVAVGVVCAIFWESIVDWLKRVANKISEKLKKVVYGTKILALKKGGLLKKLSKHFVRNESEWVEYCVEREMDEEEIPDFIRGMENGEEQDITSELELQLA